MVAALGAHIAQADEQFERTKQQGNAFTWNEGRE
jgi:hypothetical protein